MAQIPVKADEDKLVRELREAFANHDEEEAQRIAASLPVFDIDEMRPGDVIAIHFTRSNQEIQDER